MGLVGLVNVIALEGAKHGITANGLLPAGSGRLGRPTDVDVDWPPEFREHLNPEMAVIRPAMRNDFVTPMVLWLVSEACRTTHSLYSATAGRFARVFIGATQGWMSDHDEPPSPEDIGRRMAEIEDTSHFDIPGSMFREFDPIVSTRKAKLSRGG